mgnify:CR=1 FL=1
MTFALVKAAPALRPLGFSARPERDRRRRHCSSARFNLVAASSSSSQPSSSSPRPQQQPPPLLRPAPEGPSHPPIVVVALGGNALLRRGEEPTAANQRRHAAEAAAATARLFFETFDSKVRLVITHGNGPQVGLLASAQPLEQLGVLDAETQGAIGLTLANGIDKALSSFSSDSSNAIPPSICLVTRVVVSADDTAFSLPPTKPIGPGISKERAEELSQGNPGLRFVEEDGGRLLRRAVPSPSPVSIVEIDSIRKLLSCESSGASPVGPIICGGGGGVPVVVVAGEDPKSTSDSRPDSDLSPVEAVIDKDATSELLASLLGASALLLLTDAEALYAPEEWEASRAEKRRPRAVKSPATPEEVEALLPGLPEGSMRPKAAAAARAARGGVVAGIGSLVDATEILMGTKGTLVVPSDET